MDQGTVDYNSKFSMITEKGNHSLIIYPLNSTVKFHTFTDKTDSIYVPKASAKKRKKIRTSFNVFYKIYNMVMCYDVLK